MKFSRSVVIGLMSATLLLSSLPAFAAKVGTVSGDKVPLYDNPDKSSSSAVNLNNGDIVTISNYKTKGFYKARTESGEIGWIDSNSLLVGEAAPNSDVDAPEAGAAAGQTTPPNPGSAQVNTPPANQNPQSADELIPAPPSTPGPNTPPAEEIPEVPAEPAAPAAPTQAAQDIPPPLPDDVPAPNAAATAPAAPSTATAAASAVANSPVRPEEPPPPLEDVPMTPGAAQGGAPTASPPIHELGSSTFTYEDVVPGLSYEFENHRAGPRPVEHHFSGRKPYSIELFGGVDGVSMSDMNNLLGGSIFKSVSYFGGEFGYMINDEVKVIARVEYLTKSSNGGTADLSLSSNPVSLGVGFRIGRWKYVRFYASGLVGIGFNTQLTATDSNAPAPNQTTLSESTFMEMAKLDAAVTVYKSVGVFAEAGYRFLKTSSLSPSQVVNGTSIFSNNGTYTPTALDLSGPFIGAGVSFQF